VSRTMRERDWYGNSCKPRSLNAKKRDTVTIRNSISILLIRA
jgi:hypothetical protein